MVIDNATQQIVTDMLSSAELRRIARERLAYICDQLNAPQPGGPWCELPIMYRVMNMEHDRAMIPDGLTITEQINWIDGKNQTGG